ncbi:hypothetical protein EVAR_49570_1 [Eumeta japonica]|uniref:Uncharacterized protein n=1 Tax=Eumeta variegata TaxID=151549 RepID=A0A4C1YQW1_EUMVA|nr:hypothetical protein EVAR_49570_1 [Eumeta japonica]
MLEVAVLITAIAAIARTPQEAGVWTFEVSRNDHVHSRPYKHASGERSLLCDIRRSTIRSTRTTKKMSQAFTSRRSLVDGTKLFSPRKKTLSLVSRHREPSALLPDDATTPHERRPHTDFLRECTLPFRVELTATCDLLGPSPMPAHRANFVGARPNTRGRALRPPAGCPAVSGVAILNITAADAVHALNRNVNELKKRGII